MTADPSLGASPRRDAPAAVCGADAGAERTGSVAAPTATIYTTPDCVQCVATKRAFDKLAGVTYTVVDVSTDSDARNMLVAMGYRATPVVITTTGQYWSGFRPDRIHALSNQAVLASEAASVAADDRSTAAGSPPPLDGAARAWAQAMAERMRTRVRAVTDSGLSL